MPGARVPQHHRSSYLVALFGNVRRRPSDFSFFHPERSRTFLFGQNPAAAAISTGVTPRAQAGARFHFAHVSADRRPHRAAAGEVAHARARQRWPSLRASAPVILGFYRRPARVRHPASRAIFMLTQGGRASCANKADMSSRSSASSPLIERMQAAGALRRRAPPYLDRALPRPPAYLVFFDQSRMAPCALWLQGSVDVQRRAAAREPAAARHGFGMRPPF